MKLKNNIFVKVFCLACIFFFSVCSFNLPSIFVSAQEELNPVIQFEPDEVRLELDEEMSVNLKVFNVTNLSSAELILVFTDNVEIISSTEVSENVLVANKVVEDSIITMDLAKTENSFVEGEVIVNIKFKLRNLENGLIEVVEGTSFGGIPVNLTEGRLKVFAIQDGQVISNEIPEDIFEEIAKESEAKVGNEDDLNSDIVSLDGFDISSLETSTIVLIVISLLAFMVILYAIFRLIKNRN